MVSSTAEALARQQFTNDVIAALLKYHLATGGGNSEMNNAQARMLLSQVARLYESKI